jgi:hypothetical protein
MNSGVFRFRRRILVSNVGLDAFPDITLSKDATFAAFSVARTSLREDQETDRVNTYLLYQDDSTDIKQVWLDNDTVWLTSSPKALRKADKGTGIACISTPMWPETGPVKANVLNVASKDLTRCYFQKGGKLVEVVHDGGADWQGPSPVFKDL